MWDVECNASIVYYTANSALNRFSDNCMTSLSYLYYLCFCIILHSFTFICTRHI